MHPHCRRLDGKEELGREFSRSISSWIALLAKQHILIRMCCLAGVESRLEPTSRHRRTEDRAVRGSLRIIHSTLSTYEFLRGAISSIYKGQQDCPILECLRYISVEDRSVCSPLSHYTWKYWREKIERLVDIDGTVTKW